MREVRVEQAERPEEESESLPSMSPAQLSQDEGVAQNGRGPQRKIRPDLVEESVVQGAHPGDRYVRYDRRVGDFRRSGRGRLRASPATHEPRTGVGRFFNRVKQVLIGRPISNELSIHERLTKVKAMAVLSSDPLSSVAYATEEILRVLLLAGAGAVSLLTLPTGLAIVVLLAIVTISYWQTIGAYPRGGGSYTVAKDNLGTIPGLTAGASLMLDYIMTVAVSVAAGIAALYSLFPDLRPYRVEICIVVIVLITVANLRGVRESGNIFAAPTYLFIAGMLGLIGYGLLRVLFGMNGQPTYVPPAEIIPYGAESLSLFLILRAFTQGCTALTGVEAISNGVPAFKPVESRNAQTTLVWMAVTAITMFSGITFLATQLKIQPSEDETVLSQIARTIFPEMLGGNPLWFYVQIATALILVLAANTAFTDFPRLSYFVARDGYLPHQYAFRGDKLAFSWGIVTLAIVACILIIAFDGDTTALIPLYTVGVFTSFTLSQTGMVARWWRTRTRGWRRSIVINGLGALTTGVVLVLSAVTKFTDGAWIVIVLTPLLIALFLAINRHYRRVRQEFDAMPVVTREYKHTFIVPIAQMNSVAVGALHYARSLSPNVTAVHVAEGEDPEEAEEFNRQWREKFPDTDINLVIIESPYRSLVGPLLSYIDAIDRQDPNDTISVVLPEFLPARPWEYLLHNQSALRLKTMLLFRPNTAVTNLPYRLGRQEGREMQRSFLGHFPWAPLLALLGLLALLFYLLL
jgi:amino acid transporter